MNAKEAVAAAKAHVTNVFGDDLAAPPVLEEIWFGDVDGIWSITLRVQRSDLGTVREMLGMDGHRDLKVVRLQDRDGKVLSIRNRDMAPA